MLYSDDTDDAHGDDNEALMMINCCFSHKHMNIFIRYKNFGLQGAKIGTLGITFPPSSPPILIYHIYM